MKIALAIPFHLNGNKENECYSRVMRYYDRVCPSNVDIHICGSEGSFSRDFVQSLGLSRAVYKEVPQSAVCVRSSGDDHLRRKFNDSLATFERSYSWYALAGANDMVPPSVFYELDVQSEGFPSMLGVSVLEPLIINDIVTEDKFRVGLNYKVKLNPGINIFSKAGMAACGWKPYKMRGCETGAEELFNQLGYIIPLTGFVTMLKGNRDLNTTEKIKRVHRSFELTEDETILADYDKHL